MRTGQFLRQLQVEQESPSFAPNIIPIRTQAARIYAAWARRRPASEQTGPIQVFQKHFGLPVTGWLDPETWEWIKFLADARASSIPAWAKARSQPTLIT